MNARLLSGIALTALVAVGFGPVSEARAAGAHKESLKSIIAGAKKEGVLNLYAASSMRPQGAIALMKALNKRYGLNLDVHYSPSGSMTRDVAKEATVLAAGATPDWDMMIVNDAHYATLFKNHDLGKVNWADFGVMPKQLMYDGWVVAVATQFVAPAYNKQLVKPADVPRHWSDLLNPKWKGKIGVPSSTHHWARLVQLWGEKKTDKFVAALAKQDIVKGRVPEVYTRLQLGEVLVAADMVDDYIIKAKRTGAPVVFMPNPNPVIATEWGGAPLKHAKHRDAAILMTVFLSSPEGQTLWHKVMGQSSRFVKGTPAYEFAKGRTVVGLSTKFALTRLGKLTRKYGKMLGYR